MRSNHRGIIKTELDGVFSKRRTHVLVSHLKVRNLRQLIDTTTVNARYLHNDEIHNVEKRA